MQAILKSLLLFKQRVKFVVKSLNKAITILIRELTTTSKLISSFLITLQQLISF